MTYTVKTKCQSLMTVLADPAIDGKGFKALKVNTAGTMKLMEYRKGLSYAIRFYSAVSGNWMDIESCDTLAQAKLSFKSFGG